MSGPVKELVLGARKPANRRDRVSVVDDDDDTREAIASLVRSTGLEVETFASAQDFLEVAGKRLPDCLVLDVDMPGFSGLRLQEELARSNVRVPIIFVTGHGDIPTSVRAIKAGAREFFTKPFDADELIEAILAIVAHRRAGSEERARGTSGDPLAPIVGQSASLREALRQVETVARTESTVLITARAARARSSSRAPSTSIESAQRQAVHQGQLRGHPDGAHRERALRLRARGVHRRRWRSKPGRFELANGGTLFLDEIGEIPIEMQVKLLRVLQESEFERVGGIKTIRVDVRLVAATNRDLKKLMVAGRSSARTSIYRLNVVPIRLPALRERTGGHPAARRALPR